MIKGKIVAHDSELADGSKGKTTALTFT